MRLCLDTNAYSDWTRGIRWVDLVAAAERVYIPSIVLGELREGFLGGSKAKENKRVLREILRSPMVDRIDVDEAVSSIYAELKFYLRRQGTPIPVNDVWIAAACVERGATLLTRDRHFEHMPQVRVRWPENLP